MSASPNRLDDQETIDHLDLVVVEAPIVPAGQSSADDQTRCVGGGPNIRSDQRRHDSQCTIVAAEQSPHLANRCAAANIAPPSGDPNCLDDQAWRDSQPQLVVEAPIVPAGQTIDDGHRSRVGGDPNIRSDQTLSDTHCVGVAAEQSPHSANGESVSIPDVSSGDLNCGDHGTSDPQREAVAASTPPGSATTPSVTTVLAPTLADPMLALAAEIVDDLEGVLIANQNRLRALTGTEPDEDGVLRGFGRPLDDPMVRATALLVEATAKLEHSAVLNLQRMMRKHPLGPWAKGLRGVGDKQIARLLAAVGDPYWNHKHNRPRTVAELRSYCGWGDARRQVRRRGEKAAWSDAAKKRAWLIADSCKQQLTAACKAGRPAGRIWVEHLDGCACSPYRIVYDEARRRYEGTVHDVECRRCGPAGKPALPGSLRAAGHQEAMALRMVSKALLKDLWIEARRLHHVTRES